MNKQVRIFGGGTFSHVRPHLALAAPAFGETARVIRDLISYHNNLSPVLHLTKMAGGGMVTNADVAERVQGVVANPLSGACRCDPCPFPIRGGVYPPVFFSRSKLRSINAITSCGSILLDRGESVICDPRHEMGTITDVYDSEGTSDVLITTHHKVKRWCNRISTSFMQCMVTQLYWFARGYRMVAS
jgi:hypothetical protein